MAVQKLSELKEHTEALIETNESNKAREQQCRQKSTTYQQREESAAAALQSAQQRCVQAANKYRAATANADENTDLSGLQQELQQAEAEYQQCKDAHETAVYMLQRAMQEWNEAQQAVQKSSADLQHSTNEIKSQIRAYEQRAEQAERIGRMAFGENIAGFLRQMDEKQQQARDLLTSVYRSLGVNETGGAAQGHSVRSGGFSGQFYQDRTGDALHHVPGYNSDSIGPNQPSEPSNSSFSLPSSASYSSVSRCGSFEELSGYLESKYGLHLDASVRQLDFDTVKASIMGIEAIIKDYPDVGELLLSATTSKSGIMSCSGDKITFNPDYYGNASAFRKECVHESSIGYWVPNSSPESIGAHEATHGIEWAIIQANSDYSDDSQRITAWNDCTEATKIVREAILNVQKTSYGNGKSAYELINGISGYANTNRSETMAEAFADVYANGGNANPLSIEITQVTQRVLSEYKERV